MKKINPIEVTILPIAAELEQFCKALPPDLSQMPSLYFERLFKRLDIDLVRVWLDKSLAADTAAQFALRLNHFLVKLQRWENSLRCAGIYSTEQFEALQDSDTAAYWDMRDIFDDVVDYAEETITLLKNIAKLFQEKLDNIGLKDAQITVLCDMTATPNIYRALDDIHGTTGDTTNISRPSTYNYLEKLVLMKLVEKNSARGGYKITEKGLDYLRLIGQYDD